MVLVTLNPVIGNINGLILPGGKKGGGICVPLVRIGFRVMTLVTLNPVIGDVKG